MWESQHCCTGNSRYIGKYKPLLNYCSLAHKHTQLVWFWLLWVCCPVMKKDIWLHITPAITGNWESESKTTPNLLTSLAEQANTIVGEGNFPPKLQWSGILLWNLHRWGFVDCHRAFLVDIRITQTPPLNFWAALLWNIHILYSKLVVSCYQNVVLND